MRRIVGLTLVLLLPALLSCGTNEPCQGRVGDGTVDPNGASCVYNCECNNQEYAGHCAKGTCVSTPRGSCENTGAERICVPAIPGLKCKHGKQICKPPYLEGMRWGDCEPLEPAPSENGKAICFGCGSSGSTQNVCDLYVLRREWR